MQKPEDYDERRKWQDEFRARGNVPPCGRNACTNLVFKPYLNKGTPLIYCEDCAALINHYRPADPLCYPEPLNG